MLWVGSCFAESMAPFLQKFRFRAETNPFGVAYHPLVLFRLMQMPEEELKTYSFEDQGVWRNFLLPAHFSGSKPELEIQISAAVRQMNNALQNLNWLVMTWGTAYYYVHERVGLVGKCHKQPKADFGKKCSTVDSLIEAFENQILPLQKGQTGLKIILTVSPVRHTRDGIPENMVSKSILRMATEILVKKYPDIFYFPAYEIMMDELRDYRFYQNDLVHPTEEAVGYIWKAFEKQFLTEEMRKTNHTIQDWDNLRHHQPLANQGQAFELWKMALKKAETAVTNRLESGF